MFNVIFDKLCIYRFADKQLRLLRLKAARAQLEEKCMKALERHKQRDKLVFYNNKIFKMSEIKILI